MLHAVEAGHISRETLDAREEIIKSLQSASSIDDFVHMRQDDAITEYAKISIAYHIGKSEHSSQPLDFDGEYRVRVQDTKKWAHSFWNLISKGYTIKNIDKIFENIYIINFNYDRFIEEYLLRSICASFSAKESDANKILSTLNIVHPYGALSGGHLTQNQNAHGYGDICAQQGDSNSFDSVLSASRSLLTYTETVNSETEDHVKNFIKNSRRLAFLGFGYHPQNLGLLKVNPIGSLLIFGTAFGESEQSKTYLRNHLAPAFATSQPRFEAAVKLSDSKCNEFFWEFGRAFQKIIQ